MAHRCVKCGKIYYGAAPEILKGCTCGSHYFFFFREGDQKIFEQTERLTKVERDEIVKDVDKIVGQDIEKPIILNLASIRITKPGKFELDLVNILKRKPIIYQVEDGKYIIDIPSTFQLRKGLKGKENDLEEFFTEPLEEPQETTEKKEEPKIDEVTEEEQKDIDEFFGNKD